MPFNEQYMGFTGDASSGVVVFPPQAKARDSNITAVNDPLSPTEIMSAAPNSNEIWKIQAGTALKTYLSNNESSKLQVNEGQIYVGKRLLGGLGTRWYHVISSNQIVGQGAANAGGGTNGTDRNFQQSFQQSMRVHPGETLVLAFNPGSTTAGDAWAHDGTLNQITIPFLVAAGVSPAQMRASLSQWG